MNRIFLTSDTHFGHGKMLEYQPVARPFATIEQHDRALVERWNATVKPNDTVWHLGDVFIGKDNHWIMQALNGIKKLVMGNHDVYDIEIYKMYFSKISGAAKLNGCVLTHIPVHPMQLDVRYKMNIHGHLHDKALPDKRYRCVSVERTGLAPVAMELVLRGDEQC